MTGEPRHEGHGDWRERAAVALVVAWVALSVVVLARHAVAALVAEPSGLAASYFPNSSWRGTAVVEERVPAPTLEAVERGSIPLSPRHMSARFDGWLVVADPGSYRLDASFDDLLAVVIDGRRVVPVDGHENERRAVVAIELTRGAHELAIRFANLGADGRLEFALARTGRAWPWRLPPRFAPPGEQPRIDAASVTIERLARSWPWISLVLIAIASALTWKRQRAIADGLGAEYARRARIVRALASPGLQGIAVAAIATAVFFTDLGARPVARHDEDTHTRVALETSDARQWWPLVYYGAPYARKPPLKLWLSAATFRWLGADEWWVRAWDASFAVGTTVVTYALGRRLRGAGAGLVAAAVLITCDGYVFHHAARDGVQDSAMIFGFTAAVALGSAAPLTRAAAAGAAIALIATSLTKPAMGLIPLAILALHRWLGGRRRELASAPFVAMGAAAIAAPLAWQLAGWLSVPGFVETSVGEQIVGRIAGTSEPWNAQPWWFYFPAQLTSLVGWWPLVPVALAGEVWRARRARQRRREGPVADASAPLLVLWPVVVFVAATGVSLKLPWYVYPAYPAFAIAIGSLATSAIGAVHRRVGARWPAVAALAIGALMALLGARIADTVERARAPSVPLIVQRWVAFLSQPERASWRVLALGVDPARDFDDPTFYYLHRLGERIEHVATDEALASALAGDPERPTLVMVSPRRPVPDALAARASARFTLPEPYGRELPVLGFGAIDAARVPLVRS